MSEVAQSQGYFFELTPERVLEAVESSGLICTGRCFALNSYENRVYDVELESEVFPEGLSPEAQSVASVLKLDRRIVKFYRPGRWSEAQILEEHQFLKDLNEQEIPAIGPLAFEDGSTLRQIPGVGIYFSIFPKVGGRAPDEFSDEQLRRVGRLLARIHNVGAARKAPHRIALTPQSYGLAQCDFLIQGGWVPMEYEARYRSVVGEICALAEGWFKQVQTQRIHGDCHLGNLLWNQQGPFFLDFDDMVNGPPVQDLWMLMPGRDEQTVEQRKIFLEGYEEFRDFDYTSLRWIEALRALRIINYSAWIARRWNDPVFPRIFPNFKTHQYWGKEVEVLEETLRLVQLRVDSGFNLI